MASVVYPLGTVLHSDYIMLLTPDYSHSEPWSNLRDSPDQKGQGCNMNPSQPNSKGLDTH